MLLVFRRLCALEMQLNASARQWRDRGHNERDMLPAKWWIIKKRESNSSSSAISGGTVDPRGYEPCLTELPRCLLIIS